MSDGNYLRALSLIETSEEAKESFEAFTQMMRLSYTGRVPDLIKWVDNVSQWGRERQKSLLEYSLKMVRENLIINQQKSELARVSDDESKFAINFSKFRITSYNVCYTKLLRLFFNIKLCQKIEI